MQVQLNAGKVILNSGLVAVDAACCCEACPTNCSACGGLWTEFTVSGVEEPYGTYVNGTYNTLWGQDGPASSQSFQEICQVQGFDDQEVATTLQCFEGMWELMVVINDYGGVIYGLNIPADGCPPSTYHLTSADRIAGTDVGSFTVVFN